MSKIKLTFVAAAICGGLLALAPMSGAFAAPMAPIGKAANAIDPRSVVSTTTGIIVAITVTTGIIITHITVTTGTIMAIIVTVGGTTVVGSAVGDTVNNSRSHMATVTGSP